MSEPPRPREPGAARASRGLCPTCAHVRHVHSDRGSTFLRCELARSDASLPRYPPQPRLACHGFES